MTYITLIDLPMERGPSSDIRQKFTPMISGLTEQTAEKGSGKQLMNVLGYGIIFCISIALFGCPAARPKHIEQPDAPPLHGTFTHPSSGMKFPAKVGEFERSSIVRHNIIDPELTIRYDLISMAVSVAVAVDVYPAPQLDTTGVPASMVAIARENLSHQEFGARMREITSAHPGAILIQEDEFSLPQKDNPYMGKMAVFEYEDVFLRRRQVLHSTLYLFCFAGGEWNIKYQFTYAKDADARYHIDHFMMNLPWTLIRSVPSGSK